MKELEAQVIKETYERRLTHLGSNLTAVGIIDEIYALKKPTDKFVLSAGHAHLAHAIIKEKYGEGKVDDLMVAGIHCDKENGCDVSTGSLGQGLPIALGMALADRERDVYCLITDGECAEGSVWEALRIKSDQQVTNLHVYVNANGYGAYDRVDTDTLEYRLKAFNPDIQIRRTVTEGIADHYRLVTEEEYGEAIEK